MLKVRILSKGNVSCEQMDIEVACKGPTREEGLA